jgi:RNA polymerase sigma-70 factor, ECF subfamily
MASSPQESITAMLLEGQGPVPLERLLPALYDELRVLAGRRLRRESLGLTLSPTELVHEAYLRLADSTRVTARGRAYFFAAAAQAMRRIIVDHVRRRGRQKRGGGDRMVTLHDDAALTHGTDVHVLDLERGLDALAELNPRAARVVECRFYGGLSIADTALALNVTTRTVNRDWQFARAWLYDSLSRTPGPIDP